MVSKGSILIAYGFSGSQRLPSPTFPDGLDYDRSLEMSARTLAGICKKLFGPSEVEVKVVQAWTKKRLFDALDKEPNGHVRQVHVLCHGGESGLYLAYHYDRGNRLDGRAKKINAMVGKTDQQKAIEQWKQEDAIMVGHFIHYLNKGALQSIRDKHAKDAYWHIWGCFSGEEKAYPDTVGSGDPQRQPYFARFLYGGKSPVDGIAIQIARQLQVTCTAATGSGGAEYWVRDKGRNVRKARTQKPADPAVEPFWLWTRYNSRWVTYKPKIDPTDPKKVIVETVKDTPTLFQWTWRQADLVFSTTVEEKKGRPPQWMIDAYR